MVRDRALIVGCCSLVALTLAAYFAVCANGFVNYDDDLYVSGNPHVLGGISGPNLAWALTTFHAANWHPLTWISLQLDAQLHGREPWGYHLTNLLLHAANVGLLFLVLVKMTGSIWRSGIVAALFATHPLHVESVAWVAERKDVLSTFFGLLTLGAYLGYVRRPHASRYLLVLVAFALALMSKPMLVTLPCVLLLLDFWPLGRFRGLGPGGSGAAKPRSVNQRPVSSLAPAPLRALFWEKLPLFVLAATASVLTLQAQARGGAVESLNDFPLGMRIANALVSYVRYLGKTFWPLDLTVLYDHPRHVPIETALAAGFAVAGISALVLSLGRRFPYLVVGWLWFLGTLVPVIGLVQVGLQALADRYMYVPSIGLFLALVWAVADLAGRWRARRVVLTPAVTLILAVCTALTWFQVGYWHDSRRLWAHALEQRDCADLRLNNQGVELWGQGRVQEAIEHFAAALRFNPHYAEAHHNLGRALMTTGRDDEAIEQLAAALQEAQSDKTAAQRQPLLAFGPAHQAETHLALGLLLERRGELDAAAGRYLEALRLRPDFAEAFCSLGVVRGKQGRPKEELACYRRAVELKPNAVKFHCNLASALHEQGQCEAARAEYRAATLLSPNWPRQANDLAWSLATAPDPARRDGFQAIRLAQQACQATEQRRPEFLDTLAAAYAEAGHFELAAATARSALAQATDPERTHLAAQLQTRLRLYESQHRFRMDSQDARHVQSR